MRLEEVEAEMANRYSEEMYMKKRKRARWNKL